MICINLNEAIKVLGFLYVLAFIRNMVLYLNLRVRCSCMSTEDGLTSRHGVDKQ